MEHRTGGVSTTVESVGAAAVVVSVVEDGGGGGGAAPELAPVYDGHKLVRRDLLKDWEAGTHSSDPSVTICRDGTSDGGSSGIDVWQRRADSTACARLHHICVTHALGESVASAGVRARGAGISGFNGGELLAESAFRIILENMRRG
jgi:hypothetical protein